MRTFLESFKHKAAKELLFNWLKECEKINIDYCELNPFSWRKNYGVFIELPFHESDDPYYFELSKGIKCEANHTNCFDPNFDRGKILFRPDITIFHKGTPKYIIEVFHTNRVSNLKKAEIFSFFHEVGGVELHEIHVDEILNKTSKPTSINTFCTIL